MTDLAKGIIEIDGFNIKPGTDISDPYRISSSNITSFGKINITPETFKTNLLSVYGDKLSDISNNNYLRFKMLFLIDDSAFSCEFHFDNEGLISRVMMSPFIQYKSESWDRTGKQEERREFCDKWLYERLGEPHNILNGDIEYTFSNVRISCFSNFDIHHGADAGYIVIRYLR